MRRARHIKMTKREFQKKKRRELRAVMKAMDELQYGCAYLPEEAYDAFQNAAFYLKRLQDRCRPWWRKA